MASHAPASSGALRTLARGGRERSAYQHTRESNNRLSSSSESTLAQAATIRPRSIPELADRPWISGPPESACGRALDRLAEQYRITPRRAHVCLEFPSVLGLVAGGFGARVGQALEARERGGLRGYDSAMTIEELAERQFLQCRSRPSHPDGAGHR